MDKNEVFVKRFSKELGKFSEDYGISKTMLKNKSIALLSRGNVKLQNLSSQDINLVFSAVIEGGAVYERAKWHLDNLSVFGDLNTALVAAGVD